MDDSHVSDPVPLKPPADEALLEWFLKNRDLLPDLPFNPASRNSGLRSEILKRVLGAVLTDDERAAFFGMPAGCRIREGAKIISPENLTIGESCWVGENAILDASGGLSIGSHTSIGLSVFVWSHSSHLTNLTMQNSVGSALIQRRATRIGQGCFIAGPAVILPGVTIGDRVIVRPFTTVSRDIPDRSLVDREEVAVGILTEDRISRMLQKHRAAGS